MKKIVSIIVFLLFVVATSFLFQKFSWFSARATSGATQALATTNKSIKKERKILYWVAPMDSNYRRDKPGKSPMGMDLVPVYADENADDTDAIKISAAVEHNIGVKTSEVKYENLPRVIQTVGYVTADENNIEHIHSYTNGWVKSLKVKAVGEYVSKGQLILTLHSPALTNAQEEYLLALKNKNATLINAAEKKLLTLGLNTKAIEQLKTSQHVEQYVSFYAEHGGIVSKLNIREGMYVNPNMNMMTIEDLSTVWVIAEVFERQANWVKQGQTAMANLSHSQDKIWEGKVDYVYPHLNPKTHTVQVRLSFANPKLMLKPNMYADIKIFSSPAEKVLTIPAEALIRTGEGDRVVMALGEGRYRSQPITISFESEDKIAVQKGLQVGEKVVSAAQFLIDSESNTKASFNRMENANETSKEKKSEASPTMQNHMHHGH